jgi:hypothetical protein
MKEKSYIMFSINSVLILVFRLKIWSATALIKEN